MHHMQTHIHTDLYRNIWIHTGRPINIFLMELKCGKLQIVQWVNRFRSQARDSQLEIKERRSTNREHQVAYVTEKLADK